MRSLPRQALDRAKGLLSEPTEHNLRYAALELRMVMEMVTYEKLFAAQDVLPPEVVRTWQARQAVKALLEFQPLADETYTISFAEVPEGVQLDGLEDSARLKQLAQLEYQEVGQHHGMKLKWLGSNYNRIGGLLHAVNPGSSAMEKLETAAYLAEVVAELELVVSSTIYTLTERGGYVFECIACEKPIVRNFEAMKAGKTAICSTPHCDAEYRLVKDGENDWTLQPVETIFTCPSCSFDFRCWSRKVEVGVGFTCPGCKRRYGVHAVHKQWQFHELAASDTIKVRMKSMPNSADAPKPGVGKTG